MASTSFNFSKFTSSDSSSIILQGSSKILSNGILALTDSTNAGPSVGRALYSTPVHIWDSTTNNVASFVTSFSFVIADLPGYDAADGIIFFLAPEGTQIPSSPNRDRDAGLLGVANYDSAFNQFVGVEFDTWSNPWDPSYSHIGINVNSFISLKTVKWNKVSGSLVQVNIIYDSLSKTLTAVATNDNGEIFTVAQVVDLKVVLPEKVMVGFSAAISIRGNEVNDIHSWSFTSTFETI